MAASDEITGLRGYKETMKSSNHVCIGGSGLDENQIEFFSEDQLVTILPNVELPRLDFICQPFGPFRPMTPVQVPLWLALTLKKRGNCRIHPPEWLDSDYLENIYQQESSSPEFVKLPWHFMPIAYQLIHVAPDDIREVQKVRAVLEDIWERRAAKIREGLLINSTEARIIKLNGITSMELNSIRSFSLASTIHFRDLADLAESIGDQSTEGPEDQPGMLNIPVSQNPFATIAEQASRFRPV